MEDFHFSISAFQIKLRHFSSILRQQYLCYPTLSLGFSVFFQTVPIGHGKIMNIPVNKGFPEPSKGTPDPSRTSLFCV